MTQKSITKEIGNVISSFSSLFRQSYSFFIRKSKPYTEMERDYKTEIFSLKQQVSLLENRIEENNEETEKQIAPYKDLIAYLETDNEKLKKEATRDFNLRIEERTGRIKDRAGLRKKIDKLESLYNQDKAVLLTRHANSKQLSEILDRKNLPRELISQLSFMQEEVYKLEGENDLLRIQAIERALPVLIGIDKNFERLGIGFYAKHQCVFETEKFSRIIKKMAPNYSYYSRLEDLLKIFPDEKVINKLNEKPEETDEIIHYFSDFPIGKHPKLKIDYYILNLKRERGVIVCATPIRAGFETRIKKVTDGYGKIKESLLNYVFDLWGTHPSTEP